MKLIFSSVLILTLSSFFGGMVFQCVDFWSENSENKRELASSVKDEQEESDPEKSTEEESENESEQEEEQLVRFHFAVFQQFTIVSAVKDNSFEDHFYASHSPEEQHYSGKLFSPPELMI